MMTGLREQFKDSEDVMKRWPDNDKLDTEEARAFFDDLCKKNDVECGNPRTVARLIDKLCGEYIETTCKDPAFIIDTP